MTDATLFCCRIIFLSSGTHDPQLVPHFKRVCSLAACQMVTLESALSLVLASLDRHFTAFANADDASSAGNATITGEEARQARQALYVLLESYSCEIPDCFERVKSGLRKPFHQAALTGSGAYSSI